MSIAWPYKSVQRTGASRFAQRQIERHRRLAPVADLGVRMRTGRREDYFVAEWPDETEDFFLQALLEDHPQLVEGRYVAIVSIDSGSYVPSEADRIKGWRSADALAFSPKVESWRDLPTDMYDEWYVFDHAVAVDAIDPSVNFQGFSPIDYGWTEKLDRFWEQVSKLRPLHVLGDGQFLYLVTRDARLFNEIIHAEPGGPAQGRQGFRSE